MYDILRVQGAAGLADLVQQHNQQVRGHLPLPAQHPERVPAGPHPRRLREERHHPLLQ